MSDWNHQISEWNDRVRQMGVLSATHRADICGESQGRKLMEQQKAIFFPHLKAQLRGTEKTILDFGCGGGRWTDVLADLIHGTAIGVDPIKIILDIAEGRSKFLLYENGVLPIESASIDVVWSCSVLNTIKSDDMLDETVKELHRVLRPDGLYFMTEVVAVREPELSRWSIQRTVEEYQAAFAAHIPMTYLGDCPCLQCNGILAGRKV
jgi:SAM-dependent methyltransferase